MMIARNTLLPPEDIAPIRLRTVMTASAPVNTTNASAPTRDCAFQMISARTATIAASRSMPGAMNTPMSAPQPGQHEKRNGAVAHKLQRVFACLDSREEPQWSLRLWWHRSGGAPLIGLQGYHDQGLCHNRGSCKTRYHPAGEAPVGIEPTNRGFADLCLTTWLRRQVMQRLNLAGRNLLETPRPLPHLCHCTAWPRLRRDPRR